MVGGDMMDFYSTEAGQHASLAKQFLEGALELDAAQQKKGRILFVPTLSLAGHGLELMLKACIYLNGQTPPKRGPAGHNIRDLWVSDICEPVRGHVYAQAIMVVEKDRESLLYRGVPEADENVLPMIDEYVVELANLHGEIGYPLRYPSDSRKIAPRTPFLVKSLWGAADEMVRQPSEFALDRFLGRGTR